MLGGDFAGESIQQQHAIEPRQVSALRFERQQIKGGLGESYIGKALGLEDRSAADNGGEVLRQGFLQLVVGAVGIIGQQVQGFFGKLRRDVTQEEIIGLLEFIGKGLKINDI